MSRRRPYRRTRSRDQTSEEVGQGLQALASLSRMAEEVGEASSLMLNRVETLHMAIEMNFWLGLRLRRTGELDALDGEAFSARLSWLRSQFLASVAVADFLFALRPDTGDQGEESS